MHDLAAASTADLLGELTRRGALPPAPPDSSEWRARRRILAAIEQRDTTQVELARRLGMSQKHVSQALTGRCRLSFDLADRMLAALGQGPAVPRGDSDAT